MAHKPKDLVLWSDEALLVINKPAGLASLPDGYDPKAPHVKSVLAATHDPLYIVHRLDKDTSGVLVLARSLEAHRLLNTEFEKRRVAKTYHALVAGRPDWTERVMRLPLLPDGDRQHRTVVDRKGKRAVTVLRLLESLGPYSLIEASPQTGRTHQIRVHLAAAGFPIVGDELYGRGESISLSEFKLDYKAEKNPERPLIARLALHAFSLAFEHPITREALYFEAGYPKDLGAVINQLRKHAR
ncbi:MAG: RluA family pseudouridine synthase [Chloroflexota bacterium]|nr:MAG: RluA family pseudouridine synthase [Chloroflexota bacterium]